MKKPLQTRQTEATANRNLHTLQHFWEDEMLFNVQDLEGAIHSLSTTLPTQCFFFSGGVQALRAVFFPILPAREFHSLCRIRTLLPGEPEAFSLIVRCVALHFIVSVGGVGMSCAGLCSYFLVGLACVSHERLHLSLSRLLVLSLLVLPSVVRCSFFSQTKCGSKWKRIFILYLGVLSLLVRFGTAVDSTCVSCGTLCGPEGADGCIDLRFRRF